MFTTEDVCYLNVKDLWNLWKKEKIFLTVFIQRKTLGVNRLLYTFKLYSLTHFFFFPLQTLLFLKFDSNFLRHIESKRKLFFVVQDKTVLSILAWGMSLSHYSSIFVYYLLKTKTVLRVGVDFNQINAKELEFLSYIIVKWMFLFDTKHSHSKQQLTINIS